jgi:hypothetical protein
MRARVSDPARIPELLDSLRTSVDVVAEPIDDDEVGFR